VEAARARTDSHGNHHSGSDPSGATLPSHTTALIPTVGNWSSSELLPESDGAREKIGVAKRCSFFWFSHLLFKDLITE
jgi:hypothetical protein